MKCFVDNNILQICRNNYMDFLCKENVVGVALAFKIINGYNTFRQCLQVYVKQKLPLNKLKKKDIIPTCYKGIITDVVQSGPFKSLSLTDRIRPVKGGYSIGPKDDFEANTLTCLVTDGSSLFMLGTNHGLAKENDLPKGSIILQPAVKDGGTAPNDMVATLDNFIPLKFLIPPEEPENFLDAAIAKVNSHDLVTPAIEFIGPPTGVGEPILGIPIQKVGRTTEFTFGVITGLGANYINQFPSGRFGIMVDQVLSDIETAPGDSGALALDPENKALGQIIGNSDSFSTLTPISTVLNMLNVNLVIG